jgi:hypothetical protein
MHVPVPESTGRETVLLMLVVVGGDTGGGELVDEMVGGDELLELSMGNTVGGGFVLV